MPSVRELSLLVNRGRLEPAIDTEWFPNTRADFGVDDWGFLEWGDLYWSSTTYALNTNHAWVVGFSDGNDNGYDGSKAGNSYVRTVRGGQSDIRSFGNLIISIESAEARAAGAQWRRVGTRTWFKHNDLETGVPPGEHEIKFSSLDDWAAPEGVTVSVRAGERTSRTATYTRQAPDDSRRAAIVVLTRGKGRTDTPGIDFMALHAYNALLQRQYRQEEIYLLAYQPYFDHRRYEFGMPITVNGPVTLEDFRNGMVDRDITADDIRQAFNWAATKGTLNDPLLFKFVGHGFRDGGALHLDPDIGLLRGAELDTMVEDYQQQTGNSVVVVLEACYSGTLLPFLAGNKRVIITSAGDHQAGFTLDTPAGMGSFSRLLFSELRIGNTWLDAFREVSQNRLPNLEHDHFKNQKPQLDDNGDGIYDHRDGSLADRHRINNNLGLSSLPVSLTPLVTERNVQADERVDLRVNVGPGAHQVWASVVTPETSVHLETNGYPLKSAVSIPLNRIRDSVSWQGTFGEFHYRGNYSVTFYARDRDGFITSSDPVVFTLPHGPEATAAPVPFRSLYRPGDQVRIRIPFTPEGYRAMVALSVPGIADLLLLPDLNDVVLFDGINLPLWRSSDSLVLDLPVAAGLPEGIYTTFLLHVPVGVERVDALAGAGWRLGQETFEVTYRKD